MHLFYSPGIHGNLHTLNEEESWHTAKVLRSKAGDTLHLTDGTGNFYEAELTKVHPKACEVLIKKTIHDSFKRPWNLHVAIAPTKNIERFEWFLEKSTEIGIEEITPLICEHSERDTIKLPRLEKVIISAMKQSLKAYLPKLNLSQKFKDLIQMQFPGQKFIAYCETGNGNNLHELYKNTSDVVILIGPEGDFSPTEVEMAKIHGFVPVSLGRSRLRTETAGVVVCQTINLMI